MLEPGIYPAAVTPFDEKGRISLLEAARLMAWFESAGCKGAVLAGTNGEGPSLSAVEKRDLVVGIQPLLGNLGSILGIATPSLDEAIWLGKQAAIAGANATLVMPPAYFRSASMIGIRDWFLRVLDASPVPILVYNFPQMTGFTLTAEFLSELRGHDKLAGAKDSSGDAENLASFREVLPDPYRLFVGNETLLIKALESGWNGSISGAANVIPQALCQIAQDWWHGNRESAESRFELVLPVLEGIRKSRQPATNKAVLKLIGIQESDRVRLPLESNDGSEVRNMIHSTLGC